jgi:predicted ATP-dependent endonuclease of OLD family
MKINALKLKNFKKFEDFEIDLSKKLIILVGPNSVGKTSIIKFK